MALVRWSPQASSIVTGMRFDDMNLSQYLLCSIYASGFEKASACQQGTILLVSRGLWCDCSVPLCDWENSYVRHINSSAHWITSKGHSWIGSAATKHSYGTRRLHGCLLSCLFGKHQCICLGAEAVDASFLISLWVLLSRCLICLTRDSCPPNTSRCVHCIRQMKC